MSEKLKKALKTILEYVGIPVSFLLVGYAVIFLAARPLILSAWSVVEVMQQSQTAPETEDKYVDIFEHSTEDSGTVKASEITFPTKGMRYAQLDIPSAGISAPVFFGDGKAELKKGVGHYIGSNFPGMGSTVLLSGHNHTFLHTIDGADKGDEIILTTPYGVYTYRITDIAVKHKNDPSAFDLTAAEENLVLYTCYPLTTLGLTEKRYFVRAELVSGPKILLSE